MLNIRTSNASQIKSVISWQLFIGGHVRSNPIEGASAIELSNIGFRKSVTAQTESVGGADSIGCTVDIPLSPQTTFWLGILKS